MPFKEVLIALERIGFTDVVLPFIIVFTVVYGVLQRSKVLGVTAEGNPKSNINAMVAFVLAFFTLILVRTLEAITWFTRFLVVLLVAFVFLGILFALLGVTERYKNALMILALTLLGAVLLFVLAAVGVLNPDFVNRFLIPLVIVAGIVAAVWSLRRPLEKPKPHEKARRAEVPGLEKETESKARKQAQEEA